MNVPIPTWSVVTTADEPVQVLVGFVAHHLALGASRVVVHLDREAPETFATLASIPGCLPVDCDAAYWAGFGGAGRPPNLHRRQRLNASRWYWAGETDWVAHFDADEFLQPDGNFAEELAAVPSDIASVQILNGERAWFADQSAETIFDGVLRLQGGGRKRREVRLFGAAAPFTSWGFAGYRLWKSVTRTGLGLSLGIHFPRQKNHQRGPTIPAQTSAHSTLVHFDGLTPLHWATKLFRYDQMGMYGAALGRDDQRHAQVSYIVENAGKVSAIRDLHDLIKVVRPDQIAPLTAARQLGALTIRPAEAAWKHLPDLDLSPAAFDRELVRSRPEFARQFQDWAALSSAPKATNTWGVVCTAAEPPELLAAFAAHHLSLGAREVRIFLDNADPIAFDLLSQIPGCVPVLCDDAHWAARSDTLQRPRAHTRRQRVNATLARTQMTVDWLAHFDADEFLVPHGDLAAELAAQPAEIACVSVPNGERLWLAPPGSATTIFDGVMRRKIDDPDILTRLYGPITEVSDGGLSSYAKGKLLTRTALPVWIGIHAIGYMGEDEVPPTLGIGALTSTGLCHFEGVTPLQWALKMARYEEIGRLNKPPPRHHRHRHAQVQFVAENKGAPERIQDLIRLLKHANPDLRAELEEGGHIVPHGVDPVRALEKVAPGLTLDFSTGRFDDWLAANRPHLADFIAAWQALPLN